MSKFVIFNEVGRNCRKETIYRRLRLLKLELRRVAVERRSMHVENQRIICEVRSTSFLLPDRGLLKLFVVVGLMKEL